MGVFRKCLLFFIVLVSFQSFFSQTVTDTAETAKMQWFADAKLGIFIHYGIYSVKGIDESWSFHNKKISWPDYMQQLKGFTAKSFDADSTAALIKESGARYAVLTTKHHDGVALWNTAQKHYSTVKNTPAKRDLVAPFFAALRKKGLKAGAYFSLIDWSYPDYPGFLNDSSRYTVSNDYPRWNRFRNFYQSQISELCAEVRPDLWWFDGDWEHSPEEWEAKKVRSIILKNNPSAIINSRLPDNGDYDTPEQNFPVTRPPQQWWELCMTYNNNWGYQPQDTMFKTPFEVISIFADVISNGGNLLLGIGPREDGMFPEPEIRMLKNLGRWTGKHEEAIFGTLGGIPQGHFYGPTTLSKDSSKLYLFIPAGTSGTLMVKGLANKIIKTEVVGKNIELTPKIVGKISWSPVPGLVFIDLPKEASDEYMTVIKLSLDGPVKLYRGKGGLK